MPGLYETKHRVLSFLSHPVDSLTSWETGRSNRSRWASTPSREMKQCYETVLTNVPFNVLCTQYTVSQNNDADIADSNFNADQPISIIFGR